MRALIWSMLVASVFTVAACSSTAVTPSSPPIGTVQVDGEEEDTCGARNYRWLVGQDYKRVPPAPSGKIIRTVCAECPITRDFIGDRVNVFYDKQTGVVRQVTCG